MEIERKFRLLKLPPRRILGEGREISQGYIFNNPGELRIRDDATAYWLTIKNDGHLSRDEYETKIPKWAFELLQEHTPKMIHKTRYKVGNIEVDKYRGDLEGLIMLECEFVSKEEAERFLLPAWAAGAIEVTYDPQYKNKNLGVK